jgi:hypothetical protein
MKHVILLLAAGLICHAQTCPSPKFPGPATPIDTSTCTLEGNGGAETNQNEAKNNFCPTTTAASPLKISDLVALQKKVQTNKSIPFGNPSNHPQTTQHGPATDRAPLQALGEGKEVTLLGFVKIARQEGKESVNCTTHVPDEAIFHDIHVSIVGKANQAECTGVVAEMVPRHRFADWTVVKLTEIAAAGLPVRVTGQLMFDSSHSPCQGSSPIHGDPSRASLWEVHPIYKFEVCTQGKCSTGSGWVPLETWTKPE